jgi:hypothetical protein
LSASRNGCWPAMRWPSTNFIAVAAAYFKIVINRFYAMKAPTFWNWWILLINYQ